MGLKENLKKTSKEIKEGTMISSNDLKKYIEGEDKVKVQKFDKVTEEEPKKKKKEKFDTVSESLITNLAKTSIDSKILNESVIQVDMPMELMNSIDAGKLPKFITLGDTAYIYSGSSSPDLYKIMTSDKGVIGKVVYTQSDNEIDMSKPKEIEIEIVKNSGSKKTILSIGSINTK